MEEKGEGRRIMSTKQYRGWTIVIERCFVRIGRSGKVVWECRAYRGRSEEEVEEEAGGETSAEEVTAEMITPARSLDERTAYQEACARIDRIIDDKDIMDTMGIQNTIDATTTTNADCEENALDAEFSHKPKLLNLIYKVGNEIANHRREPRSRPKRGT